MTKTKHYKRAKPAAVELRDDALDRAAGGVLASGGIGRGIFLSGGASSDSGVFVDAGDFTIAKPRT